jgi:hypothetical protein
MPTAETVPVVTATEPQPELSEQWLELARNGQQTALETVRKFIDVVEHAVPLRGEGSARRRQLVDGALEMADHLVHAQVDLLRHAVSSVVIVDVDVGVDVDVASRATRALEEASPASARG